MLARSALLKTPQCFFGFFLDLYDIALKAFFLLRDHFFGEAEFAAVAGHKFETSAGHVRRLDARVNSRTGEKFVVKLQTTVHNILLRDQNRTFEQMLIFTNFGCQRRRGFPGSIQAKISSPTNNVGEV